MLAALWPPIPEMGCTRLDREVVAAHVGAYSVWHAAKTRKVHCRFLEDVMARNRFDIFPSKYIHIGGDEAPHLPLEKCPQMPEARYQRLEKPKADKEPYCETVTARSWPVWPSCAARHQLLNASKGRQIIGWVDEVWKAWRHSSPTVPPSWQRLGGRNQGGPTGTTW